MNKSYIVSVLDYASGSVDIFQVFAPDMDDKDDMNEFFEGVIEERGHNMVYCYYMASDPNKFKFNVDL